MPRKSRKRSLAAKKAWRTRRRNAGARKRRANPKRKPVRRKKYRRRRNAWVRTGRGGQQTWIDLRTKEGKAFRKRRRKTSKRKGRKTVARKKRKVTRRKKRRTYRRKPKWPKNAPRKHSRAAKKGWRKRRVGVVKRGRKKVYYRTSKGKRYKKPYKSRRTGRYAMYRNPDMVKDIALPLALASVGFVGSALIMTAGPVANVLAKQSPAVQKFAKIGVPIAAALGIMMFAPKVKALAKYSKHLYFLAFGLALAGGVAGVREALAGTGIGAKLGLSGYVVQPMSGYVRRPLMGYVRQRGLGQIEERVPRTLGSAMTPYGGPIEYRGSKVPAHLPGQKMRRALGFQPKSSKPYGLGLPKEKRRYNEFGWMGVYENGTYE